MPAQLGLVAPTKFSYFAIKTPVGLPCMALLEIGGSEYEGRGITFEEWGAIKATTPNGQLPVAEFADGRTMAESGAIARTIAGAAGLLGEGNDYSTSEWLAGMTVDMNKKVFGLVPTMMTIANFDEAKKAAFAEGKEGLLAEVAKFEKMLIGEGDRFTESGMTYGEVDLFCKLNCYATGPLPEVATGPLQKFYERMLADAGIAKILSGTSQFGELGNYLVPVE